MRRSTISKCAIVILTIFLSSWDTANALPPAQGQDNLQAIAIRWARIFIQNHYREELPIAEHRCIVEKIEGENIWAAGFPSLSYDRIYVICIQYKGNNQWDILKGPYVEYPQD